MMNDIIGVGEPIWIPANSMLYYPDVQYPLKYQECKTPICAWFIKNENHTWATVLYENVHWSTLRSHIFPYSQEQK
jgi:hypothetical protein